MHVVQTSAKKLRYFDWRVEDVENMIAFDVKFVCFQKAFPTISKRCEILGTVFLL